MARTREFDPQEVLEKAMLLFWHKGYAETSMRDLVEYTGVAHAGLYAAFGGKRELYRDALDHYNATFGDMLMNPLEDPGSGRADVEHFFAVILDAVKTNRFADGCFMCNTAVEFGNQADDVLSYSKGNVERMSNAFRGALEHARNRAEVPPDLDPEMTADFLVSAFHGIAVLSRANASHERIENSVQMTLKVLG